MLLFALTSATLFQATSVQTCDGDRLAAVLGVGGYSDYYFNDTSKPINYYAVNSNGCRICTHSRLLIV